MNTKLFADALRFLSMDMVEKAKSGHPGTPMGMADITAVLFSKFLKFDASAPRWPDRDRFLLSNAHASALQYALLYLTGYDDISMDDLKAFRQLDSKTAGHPEYRVLKGIEASGGPLGQGLAMAVGMALSERMSEARFGKELVDHYTYVTIGDGDLMEGISEEAISLAGHFRLNKLIAFWDDNKITIDGTTDLATSTDIPARFRANGWNVIDVDGHDHEALEEAITKAKQSDKPTMIDCHTIIGYGSPAKAGTCSAHGAPIGEEEGLATRQNLGWTLPPFEVPSELYEETRALGRKGEKERLAWEERLDKSDKKAYFTATVIDGKLPADFDEKMTEFKESLLAERPVLASRKSSQNTLSFLFKVVPNLIGGSADLSASNLTKTPLSKDITATDYSGNNIEYGIREHAMGAILNGMALHGGFIGFGGTFLSFVDYLKPSIRLAALMETSAVYVLTHDSIGVGEDGPTHQPIEQVVMLRSMPNVVVLRPADALEVAEAWEIALKRQNGPTALILSRQNLPFIRESASENMTSKGAYVIKEADGTRDVTLIATGSEVDLALQAQKALLEKGIKAAVVSMPSQELFNAQETAYKKQVLGEAPRVAIEALSSFGWEKYTGENGAVIGMTTYGASAPAKQLFQKFGFTVDNVVQTVLTLVK